jgi:hypothetical protein
MTNAARQKRWRRRHRLCLRPVTVEISEQTIAALRARLRVSRGRRRLDRADGDGAVVGSGPGGGLVPRGLDDLGADLAESAAILLPRSLMATFKFELHLQRSYRMAKGPAHVRGAPCHPAGLRVDHGW